MKNDLLLRAAKGENIDRYPVWIMRQAGRILPEYRAVRSSVKGFKELVKNPELCCEVTIQPVDILDVDAAIIFSDILVVPEAMGLDYEMIEQKGPWFEKLNSKDGIYEFRERDQEKFYRIFAFWHGDSESKTLIICTHGLDKKSNKTPKSEIEKAIRIKELFLNDKKSKK